ncbi:PKD domain-containing protein [Sediminicola luteus]|uniref:PKD domain-containing protein n=1 Tax=Sediminicola luteus TaxID=319238 RepID=A0A2A4G2G5_9FLAO|nr:PKD domain-containing protein [Sediminicola luteus]PCE62621.1 hypothetical protein B7P33_18485 [Sediminicola luteus]
MGTFLSKYFYLFLIFFCVLSLQGQNEHSYGKWSDPIPFGIVPVAVANLPDGRLLCWSSQFRNTFITTGDGATFTEIFDPFQGADGMALGEFVSNTNHDMFCPGVNNLPDGRILAAGGTTSEKTSIYDWRTGLWTVADEMNIPRGYQGNVTLNDGRVFTVGGSWGGGPWTNRDAEIWSEATGWKLLTGIKGDDFYTSDDLLGDSDAPLYRADNHIWLWGAPDGSLFHAGPSELMHWIDVDGSGSMISAGYRADDTFAMKGTTVMFDWGKILKVGGSKSYDDGDIANNNSYVIDINGGYGSLPNVVRTANNLSFSRTMHNSTVLPNGEVLVTGGLNESNLFTDVGARLTAEIYNPDSNQWRTVAGMQTPRTYHSVAILMVDGRVFVGGGGLCDATPGCVNHFDAEIYSPPYLFDSNGNLATRPNLEAPKNMGYDTEVKVTGSSNLSSLSLVRFSSATHSTNNEQRRIPIQFNPLGSGEYILQIPNRNVLPPGYYMLFAMDTNGVPSIAEVVQIGDSSDIDDADLIVSLDFEESSGNLASDSTPNGNDFEIKQRDDNGNPVNPTDHNWNGSGVFGKAMELDGKFHSSNSILTLPYNNNIDDIEEAVTVSGWVWRDSGSMVTQTGKPANVAVFAHDYPAIFGGFHNWLMKWSFATENGFVNCYAGHAPLDQWTHYAVTYDGQMARLYSNGIEICSKPITGKIRLRQDATPNSNFTISGFYEHRTNLPVVPYGNKSGITDELDGKLDRLQIYRKALSSTQIKGLYLEGLNTGVPNIPDCTDNLLVPEYKIGDSGDWKIGKQVKAPLGSKVYIRARNSNGEYFISTSDYDGPTFSSIHDTDKLNNDNAYQIDTHVYHFNNAERNNGLFDLSNVGQYAITNRQGCSTVITIEIADNNGDDCENEIIPEYRLNGSWYSGSSDLQVEEGTEVMLSMLPNGIGLEIELPNGARVTDNFNLGAVNTTHNGLYTLRSAEGCIAYINVNVVSDNLSPNAVASSDVSTGSAPLEVRFTGSGSIDDQGIVTYHWDFGDGSTSDTADLEHTYTGAGSYTATLTVTDGSGQSSQASIGITVTGSGGAGCSGVPVPWGVTDVGSVGVSGSSCYDPETGRFELEGSGSDIWGLQDSFHYVYQELSGDGEMIVRVVSMDNTHGWAKAGIMFRNSLTPNAAQALLSMHPNPRGSGPGYTLQQRETDGGSMSSSSLHNLGPVTAGFPRYLRMVRQGSQITAYGSSTNGNWQELGSRTVSFDYTIQVGLVVTSHNNTTLNKAIFEEVSLSWGQSDQFPNAVVSSDVSTGSAPLEVRFTGSGSSDDQGIVTYHWDFGDGSTSDIADPVHTYTGVGSYMATLTVTDGSGQNSQASLGITVTGAGGSGCSGVPAPWGVTDVGSVGVSGSSCYDPETGRFELEGSGSDIWGLQDSFHYVYQELSGDGEMIVRVVSMDNTHGWAKAGIMFRNSLTPNAAQALLSMHPNPRGSGPGYTLQQRETDGGSMSSSSLHNLGPVTAGFPRYLRMVRQGSQITAYGSSTNGNWQELGSRTVSFDYTIQVGLVVTSHNNTTLNKAIFEEVSLSWGQSDQFPNAVVSSDVSTGSAPLEVRFTGSGSSDDQGIVTYHWDFGDGSTSDIADPVHTYTGVGSYMATLTVTDGSGQNSQASLGITVTGAGGSGCSGVPAPWGVTDVGSVGVSGSSCYDPETGRFELEGSGSDIWGLQDSFHYVYQELSGDGEMIVRVVSMDNTHGWAKAGIMFRNSLTPNAAQALLSMHPNPRGSGPGYTLQQRETDGGSMSSSSLHNIGPVTAGFPRYLRMVRQGSQITAYGSSTKGNWQELGSRTVSFNHTIQVGLVVTSHNNTALNKAVFEDLELNATQATALTMKLGVEYQEPEIISETLEIIPNPASNQVKLTLINSNKADVLVFNSVGVMVMQAIDTENKISNGGITLEISHLSDGTYFVVVDDGLGQKHEKQLIIRPE